MKSVGPFTYGLYYKDPLELNNFEVSNNIYYIEHTITKNIHTLPCTNQSA